MSLRRLLFLTFTLTLIVVAAVIYIFKVDQPRRAEEEAAKEEEKKILPFDKASVTRVSIDGQQKNIRFRRAGEDAWMMEQPMGVDADSGAVDAILNSIESLKYERVVEEQPENLAPFGLASAEYVVSITSAGSEEGTGETTEKLFLGKDSPIAANMYVKTSRSPRVLLCSNSVRFSVEKDPSEFREKRMMKFEVEDARALHIELPEREIRMEKEGDQWWITSPLRASADRVTIETVLRTLSFLRVESFVTESAEDLSSYGLDQPATMATVLTGDERAALSLITGSLIPEEAPVSEDEAASPLKTVYAKRLEGTTIYEVAERIPRDLEKSLEDFRRKNVLDFNQWETERLSITRNGAAAWTLEKNEEGNWSSTEHPDLVVDQDKVRDLLAGLRNLKIEEYPEGGSQRFEEFGLTSPATLVTMDGKEGARLAEIAIGASTGLTEGTPLQYVRDTALEEAYLVDISLIGILPQAIDDLEQTEESGETDFPEAPPPMPDILGDAGSG